MGRTDNIGGLRRLRARFLSAALSGSACAALLMIGLPAQAVAQTTQATFDIPPGSLSGALAAFGQQADLQITYLPEIATGRRTPGVSGRLAASAALGRLLQGSGLTYRFTNARTVTIERPGATTAGGAVPAGAISLDTIDVQGASTSDPGRTEGTGSYTPSVTATATGLQLSPRETPQSISVVTQQQMNDFSLKSINEVVDHTPGLSTVQAGSGITYFYARGFAIQSLQYDGMQTYLNSVYPGTDTLRDMAMYDRVEVLKGATGLMTGAGDPGATINLIRKKPTRTFQGHTTLSVGSWDDYRGELDLSGPLNESGTVRGRFVAAHQDNKSFLDHYHRKGSVLYGIVEADLTPDTLLTVGSDYQRNIPRGSANGVIPLFNSLGEFNEMPRSFNPAARWNTWETYTHNTFTALEHRFDNDWRVKLHLNRQTGGYDAAVGCACAGFPNPADGTGVSMSSYMGLWTSKAETNVANLYATGPFWLFDRKHELVLGGSISRQNRTRIDYEQDLASPGGNGIVPDFYNWTGNVPQPGWIPYATNPNKETFKESAFYAATRLQVHDRLKVLLGARNANYEAQQHNWGSDQYRKKSGQVIPYYGAVFDITEFLSAYTSYTGIFRPQTAQNEQGATLPPLEGTNMEAGLKAAFFNGQLNASAAYFQLKQDNYALATGGLTPTGSPAYRPVDGVITKGFEVEISGQLSQQWQIQAGFTHNVSHRQNVPVSTITPANQFTLYTTYKLDGALEGLTVGGGARWMDKTWANLANPAYGTVKFTAPSYWVMDAMASYKFTTSLSATLNIRNLFDNKYYTFYDWYNGYTWGVPRSVHMSMTYKF